MHFVLHPEGSLLYLCMFSSKHRWMSLRWWDSYSDQQFWREQLFHRALLQCRAVGLWGQAAFHFCIPTFGGHSCRHNRRSLLHCQHFCPVRPGTFWLTSQKADHRLSNALQGSGLISSLYRNQWPCYWARMGSLQRDVTTSQLKLCCTKVNFYFKNFLFIQLKAAKLDGCIYQHHTSTMTSFFNQRIKFCFFCFVFLSISLFTSIGPQLSSKHCLL